MAKYISGQALFPYLVLLISLLVIRLAESDDEQMGHMHFTDCGGACDTRCALSSRPKLCKRACGTCCARCDCVPPGTSGNYDACPCYANMTTHGGRRKCP
ncbi:hypothetical protein L484_016050 [Morus notabilis]|uniref:Snakin-2 n=1 Tax=Morus notabilis TaxID=981085 RepID=W9SD52_9ROSA|nr:hypothetical protein L484_016050 [Morus notabilis]